MEKFELLNQKYALDGKLAFCQREDGFIYADVTANGAKAQILLYGAHLMSFVPAGEEEVLWMSPEAEFAEGKAVRGGVPICFPWFGPAPFDRNLPKHGFARLMEWDMAGSSVLGNGDVKLEMTLESSDDSYFFWPFEFKAVMTFVIGQQLEATLTVLNSGSTEMQYSAALHTYFNVGDAASVSIEGLSGHHFYPNGSTERQIQREPFFALEGFVDRCYVQHKQPCLIHDTTMERTIKAAKKGSNVTVLWNPWEESTRLIHDIPNDGYTNFVCVEAANNFDDTVVLQPGETHQTAIILSVEH